MAFAQKMLRCRISISEAPAKYTLRLRIRSVASAKYTGRLRTIEDAPSVDEASAKYTERLRTST